MIKQGRKSIEERQTPSVDAVASPDDIFGNALKLDPEIKAELDKQGLEGRFVDAKRLYEMGGYHKNGWVPYKRDPNAILGKSDFKFGSDPDGIVRRGSLILAVKSKEQAAKHRLYLEQKSQRYGRVNKNKAEEMRQYVKEKNVDSKIYEGFDENE